jgi:TonB family protein
MEIRIKIPLPDDPAKRALVIAVICSVLLHVALVATLFTFNTLATPFHVKRGEPLLVDLAPDRPEEKAPRGDPARPVGPPAEPADPPAPKAQAPSAPRLPPAPKLPPAPRVPPAPRAPAVAKAPPKALEPRPVPEPPKQVAKAEPPPAPKPPEPPAPSPDALSRAAESVPKAPDPAPVAPDPPRALAAPPAVPPGSGGERSGASGQTALARPPQTPGPSIFRNPAGGGGGGLQGGRGGVEGEPIPLDTPEPKYQDYFNKIREKIRANWIYPREAGDRGIQGELLIEFHIAKDGRLESLMLRNSSGAEILDRFAMNAVRLAQPFPPVPDDIAKRALAINGLFRYQIVGASLLNQYLR